MMEDITNEDYMYVYNIISDCDLKKKYRQQSIIRWLIKRKKRKFLKFKKFVYTKKYNGNLRNNKTGRFINKPNGFISITEFMKLNKN